MFAPRSECAWVLSMSRPPRDISGERFNRLTAIQFAEHRIINAKKYGFWRFQCICGASVVARKQDVVSGKKKSCGCAINNCAHRLPCGQAAFNDLYRKYQKSARRRNKSFDLTKAEFRNLTSSDCAYCGAPPSQRAGASFFKRGKRYRLNGEYTYTGVDRVDNDKGYILSNSAPCCDTCNRAKLCMSLEQFSEWVARVHERLHCTNTDGKHLLGKPRMVAQTELRVGEGSA